MAQLGIYLPVYVVGNTAVLAPGQVFRELRFQEQDYLLAGQGVFSIKDNVHIGLVLPSIFVGANRILHFKLGRRESYLASINDEV